LTNYDFPKAVLYMVCLNMRRPHKTCLWGVFTKHVFEGYSRQNFNGFKKLLNETSAFMCIAAMISRKHGVAWIVFKQHICHTKSQ